MNNRILLVTLLMLFLCMPVFAATTLYEYDELDRLHVITLENGQKITYDYDELGNILSKTVSGNVVTITASLAGNGSIYPAGTTTISAGGSATYTITPDAGNRIAAVSVDGASQGAISTYTFSNVTANHTINVTFSSTATITATTTSGGSITPSGVATVSIGGSQAYSITPFLGYMIADVQVDGVSQGAITTYSFANISTNHTITASFAKIPPVRITGNGTTPIYYQSLQAAYNVATDGNVIQATAQVFAENLTANRSISVTIDGGYTCDYSSNPDKSVIQGMPHTVAGTVTLKNFRISN